jgi:hypothetical protein
MVGRAEGRKARVSESGASNNSRSAALAVIPSRARDDESPNARGTFRPSAVPPYYLAACCTFECRFP